MRTTLTLDDDVADFLREQSRLLGIPFKQVVNRMIRSGMTVPGGTFGSPKPFVVIPHDRGFLPGVDAWKLNQMADELEVEDFATEITK